MEPQEAKRESTVKDFLEVIFRRKWIVFGIVIVAVVVVTILNVREPAVYESSAKMLVRRGEALSVFTPSVRTLTWEEEIASQIEMIRSQVIIDRATEMLDDFIPGGYERGETISAGRVNSGVISTSNVLWVTYVSRDPVFCEAAVNALVNSYQEYYQSVRTPPEMEDFFSNEMQNLKDEIDYWSERKETGEREWGVIDIQKQKQIMLNRLEFYRGELEIAEEKRWELIKAINLLEQLIEHGIEIQSISSGALSAVASEKRVFDELRLRLTDLKIEESELQARFMDENKNLKKVRKQIENVEAMLDREVEAMLLVNKSKLEVLNHKKQMLQSLIEPLQAESAEYPMKEVALGRINNTLERLYSMYRRVQEQHMSARISRASNPEWTVTILNPASRAYRKKTRDYVRMALGPFFSFMIALGIAFFIDNLDHSIKNVAVAEEAFNLPVLASFPDTKK